MTARLPIQWAPLVGLLVLAGCSGRTVVPEAGYQTGSVPELRSARVLLLPVQILRGGNQGFDEELPFALRSRGQGGDWVDAESILETVRRNPELRLELDRLPVRPFLQAEVRRVGDPLFGDLYRLGVLMNARYAVLPVELRERPEEGGFAVEVVAALLDLRTGHVLWHGILDGTPAPSRSLQGTASVAERLAARLLP